MPEVVSLQDFREQRLPHSSGACVCLACKAEWTGVWPTETIWLECPACHLHRGRAKFQHVRESEMHWTCNCGNDLFHITKQRTYCPNCGADQTGFT